MYSHSTALVWLYAWEGIVYSFLYELLKISSKRPKGWKKKSTPVLYYDSLWSHNKKCIT